MRILLVEDEKTLSDALADILRKQKYEVDAVYDGENGLEYALTGVYDLIILDVLLPRMNGMDVLSRLRRAQGAIPVLMLTALSQESDKVKGLDSGADDYLPKPFSIPELLARIRAILRRKGIFIGDNKLKYLNTELDLANYMLIAGRNSVRISVKEYEIMRYFMEKPDAIAAKEDIIMKVWGLDNEFESNNLEVYISFLRKKLLHIKSRIGIEAVRGVGYRLCEKTNE